MTRTLCIRSIPCRPITTTTCAFEEYQIGGMLAAASAIQEDDPVYVTAYTAAITQFRNATVGAECCVLAAATMVVTAQILALTRQQLLRTTFTDIAAQYYAWSSQSGCCDKTPAVAAIMVRTFENLARTGNCGTSITGANTQLAKFVCDGKQPLTLTCLSPA